MAAARSLRIWHRRIATIVGIQLFLWTVSGLVFTLRPIEEIRGEHLQAELDPPGALPARLHPVTDLLALQPAAERRSARFAWLRDRWTWAFDDLALAFDAETGAPVPEMGEAEARERAARALLDPGAAVAAEYITVSPATGEFRGGAVPAWKIDFDEPESVRVYLHARTGQVLMLRTTGWRIFDFFWGLHIMDWRAREDFHHTLMTIAAVLGVLTSASGLLLALVVYRGVWRKRRRPAAPG